MLPSERARKLCHIMQKEGFVTPPAPAAPPPGDPAAMAAAGGMPMPMDPSMAMPAGGNMPPPAPTGSMDPNAAPPPMPTAPVGDGQTVALSMADLKAILAEASGSGAGAPGSAAPAEGSKKSGAKEKEAASIDQLAQRLTNIEGMLMNLISGGAGAGAPPAAPAGQAIPPDLAAMLMSGGAPQDPMAAAGQPPMPPEAAGGMPMDPAMMQAAGAPPPTDPNVGTDILTEQAMKTASENIERFLSPGKAEFKTKLSMKKWL